MNLKYELKLKREPRMNQRTSVFMLTSSNEGPYTILRGLGHFCTERFRAWTSRWMDITMYGRYGHFGVRLFCMGIFLCDIIFFNNLCHKMFVFNMHVLFFYKGKEFHLYFFLFLFPLDTNQHFWFDIWEVLPSILPFFLFFFLRFIKFLHH